MAFMVISIFNFSNAKILREAFRKVLNYLQLLLVITKFDPSNLTKVHRFLDKRVTSLTNYFGHLSHSVIQIMAIITYKKVIIQSRGTILISFK